MLMSNDKISKFFKEGVHGGYFPLRQTVPLCGRIWQVIFIKPHDLEL